MPRFALLAALVAILAGCSTASGGPFAGASIYEGVCADDGVGGAETPPLPYTEPVLVQVWYEEEPGIWRAQSTVAIGLDGIPICTGHDGHPYRALVVE